MLGAIFQLLGALASFQKGVLAFWRSKAKKSELIQLKYGISGKSSDATSGFLCLRSFARTMERPVAKKSKIANEENIAIGSRLDSDWEEIDRGFLETNHSTPAEFPLAVLPTLLKGVVDGISVARRVTVDFVACSLIAIASGVVGNRVRLAITERRTEPGAIFMALVAPPGEGKSDGIGIARACFKALETGADNIGSSNPIAEASSEANKVELLRTSAARKRLAREGVAPVSSSVRKSDVHPRIRLLLSESTIAGIRDGLAGAPEGRTFLVDEILTMMDISGREQVRARGIILEAFDGNPRNFANGRDGEVEVEALQLTILGGTQPDLVGKLIGNNHDGMSSSTFRPPWTR